MDKQWVSVPVLVNKPFYDAFGRLFYQTVQEDHGYWVSVPSKNSVDIIYTDDGDYVYNRGANLNVLDLRSNKKWR